MSERLHKLLAQHGVGSRREIEKWMLAGRVLLNSKPAQPGDRYAEGDRVVVDGKDVTARLRVASAPRVLIYHKAQGQPIVPDAEGASLELVAASRAVMESLPAIRGSRWLVINTMQAGDSGLLLVTSDGKLADALRRRAATIPSAYVARVLAPYPEFDFQALPLVVQYDDAAVEFTSIEPAGGEGANRWFRVEAPRAHRRAAVRALFESRGLKVSRVIQVQFAAVELPRDLPRGRHRALPESETAALYRVAGLPAPIEPGAHARRTPKSGRATKKLRAGRETERRVTRRGETAGPGRRPTGSRRSGR